MKSPLNSTTGHESASMTSPLTKPCDNYDTPEKQLNFATTARNRPSFNGRADQSFISSTTLSVILEMVSFDTLAP